MPEPTRVTVVYYSSTGTTHELAREIVIGAEKAGAEVRLRKERRELPGLVDHLDHEDDVREVLRDFNRRVREALLRDSKVLVGGVNVEEFVEAWRERRFAR